MEPGVLLGIGSAAAFGGGDFAGGLAARRVPSLLVAAGAQVVGLLLLVAVVALARPAGPDPDALWLGALAGIFGGIGLAALYRGLSLGSMGLVTALSGVGSVALPALVGAAVLGTALSTGQWLGVGAAITAGAMASGATFLGVRREAIALAALAALGFGLWFIFLDLAADHGELWALVASRGSAALLIGSLALVRTRARGLGPAWVLIGAAGALDVTGNAAFVLATTSIPVGVAAALSGLYPLVTMLLARIVLRDALPPLGLAAVGTAVLGIVMISAG